MFGEGEKRGSPESAGTGKNRADVQVVLADGKPSLESAEETRFLEGLKRWGRGKSRFSRRICVGEDSEVKARS